MSNRNKPPFSNESPRSVLFLFGLALSLFVLTLAINWRSPQITERLFTNIDVVIMEDEVVHTFRSKKTPPPPPKKIAEVIDVVDDLKDLQIEIDIVDPYVDEPIEEINLGLEETDEVFPFPAVDMKPIFPGCENETSEEARGDCFQRMMSNHVINRFRFPELSRTANSQGVIVVNFIIEKDGSISSPKVLRGVDEDLDAEALRVIQALPKFQPAKSKGKPVRMSFNMPINAKIN
jgi:protein TonB